MEKLPMGAAVKAIKPLHLSQTINFTGRDENNSVEVYCEDVTIYPSSGKHESGSSKVKLKNIVDFNWELRYYVGQLLAVHVAGKYVAYGIKALGKNSGVVRVVNRDNNERSLLKGMGGMVQDIAFAHIPTQVVLAFVDELGNLLVHQVEENEEKKTVCTLLLHVEHGKESSPITNHRVIWCPFIPEDDTDSSDAVYEDVAKLLVLTHGSKAELWNVGVVTSHYGVGPLRPENVDEGYLEVNEHSQDIVDAAFSPDGTALATASLDGDVKFFQVYMHNGGGKPRCLHQWQPHEGKPLSSLFFLDNHKSYNPDVQFWKFAITGAENNLELKIWSCESWSCLQVIKFLPDPSRKTTLLKAGLDLGAGYLLLSDIFNKLLYVLQLYKDPEETCAFVRSISEFLSPYPILSFGIVDAGVRNFKSTSLEDVCNADGDDDPHQAVQAVVVRMYLVQPKSLQECHIAFQPPVNPIDADSKLSTLSQDSLLPIVFQSPTGLGVTVKLSSLLQDSLMFRDNFSDLSLNVLGNSVPEVDSVVQDLPANHLSESQQPANHSSQQPLNLMTPDAFSSPAKKDSPADLLSPMATHHSDSSPHVSRILDASISASPTLITTKASPIEDVLTLTGTTPKGPTLMPLATSELQEALMQREGFASGGSSPSREVQEILSLKGHDYFEEKGIDVGEPVVELPPKPTPPKETPQFDVLPKEKVNAPEKDGWPQIPMNLVSDVRKSVVAEEASSKRCSTGILAERLAAAGDVECKNQQHLLKVNQRLEGAVTTLVDQVNSLMDMMHEQQSRIKELSHERQRTPAPNMELLLEKALGAQHQQYVTLLAVQQQQQAVMLEGLLAAIEDKERKRQEATLSAVSQVVGNLIASKLEEVVAAEIKTNIVPAIVSSMDPLKHQLHVEMTQKLTSTDHLLKENIAKLVQSKSVMEVLSNTLVSALQPVLQTFFKEVFISMVFPSFEKACHNMFLQINDSFSKGTKEYVQTLDGQVEKQRRQQEKNRETLAESLRTSQEAITSVVQKEVQTQIHKGLASIEESVNKTLCEAVKDHVTKGFRAQQSAIEDSVISAVRSRAVTPAPHVLDSHVLQAQVLQLIAQGQINAAFQQALSASDLSMVVFVCEKVNPQQVFNQEPCPLQQNVLLSLIQQLSADMGNHTEIKHKYLEEAVMNLDPKNPVTREHMPGVIANLQRQLGAYIAGNPNNKITRSMKMLLMATQSLLTS